MYLFTSAGGSTSCKGTFARRIGESFVGKGGGTPKGWEEEYVSRLSELVVLLESESAGSRPIDSVLLLYKKGIVSGGNYKSKVR